MIEHTTLSLLFNDSLYMAVNAILETEEPLDTDDVCYHLYKKLSEYDHNADLPQIVKWQKEVLAEIQDIFDLVIMNTENDIRNCERILESNKRRRNLHKEISKDK